MSELPDGIRTGKRAHPSDKWVAQPSTGTAVFCGGPRNGTTEPIDLPAPEFDGYEVDCQRRTIGSDPMPVQIGIINGEANVAMLSGVIVDYVSSDDG